MGKMNETQNKFPKLIKAMALIFCCETCWNDKWEVLQFEYTLWPFGGNVKVELVPLQRPAITAGVFDIWEDHTFVHFRLVSEGARGLINDWAHKARPSLGINDSLELIANQKVWAKYQVAKNFTWWLFYKEDFCLL